MNLKAALLAAALALPGITHAAAVDPAEPPATPAGGEPLAGITTTGVIGAVITVGVIAAIAGGGDDNPAGTGSGGTGTP